MLNIFKIKFKKLIMKINRNFKIKLQKILVCNNKFLDFLHIIIKNIIKIKKKFLLNENDHLNKIIVKKFKDLIFY